MTIKELYIRKPFNPHHGLPGWRRDQETTASRNDIAQERAKNMTALNEALNTGFIRIDSYDFGAYRVIVLHKTTQAEAIKAADARRIDEYTAAGLDHETGLPLKRKDVFGIPVPDSDSAV